MNTKEMYNAYLTQQKENLKQHNEMIEHYMKNIINQFKIDYLKCDKLHIYVYGSTDAEYMPLALKKLGFKNEFKTYYLGDYKPTYATVKLNKRNVRKILKKIDEFNL